MPPVSPGAVASAPSDAVAAFEHVAFHFADADEDTLADIDFACRRGEVTAGAVRFNGVDVRDMPQRDLRERIAYVPQKAWLFSGTIASNLRDGDDDATEAEMRHALDVAQADFVWGLSGRLGSPVAQGGTNLSGWQRQRLSIARALMKRADIYIFDDGFSALDFKTDATREEIIRAVQMAHVDHFVRTMPQGYDTHIENDAESISQGQRRLLTIARAMEALVEGRTSFVIAHRLSAIVDADPILHMRAGTIIEWGTHAELLAANGPYAELHRSQSA